MPRPARLAQVADPAPLPRAVAAVPAREVGEALVDEDVARVAPARVGVAEGPNLVRAARRKRKATRGERAEQSPHACLDAETRGLVAARFNTAMGAGYVGILSVELHFPEAGSLKGKRKYVKSAKAQLQQRFGAAVAEVAPPELGQRSRLTLSCVARDHHEVQQLLDGAERYLGGQDFELARVEREIV